MNAPLYEHDCEKCKYLVTKDETDIYFCDEGGVEPTIITRHSDEPSDYGSGLCFASTQPLKALGVVLAIVRGYLSEEDVKKHCGRKTYTLDDEGIEQLRKDLLERNEDEEATIEEQSHHTLALLEVNHKD